MENVKCEDVYLKKKNILYHIIFIFKYMLFIYVHWTMPINHKVESQKVFLTVKMKGAHIRMFENS